jgi:hypothetical protein
VISGSHVTTDEAGSVFGLPAVVVRTVVLSGIVTGVVYALSPLTVLTALAMIPLYRWAVSDLTDSERQWVRMLLVAAIVTRVLAIAALSLSANRDAGTFATFFGDEEFYQLRGLRLYNIWMGIPISRESFLYAYDKTGYTSYQNVLIFLQILVGPAPYGIHLLNAVLFLCGTVLMYRSVRLSYGPLPALAGLAYLLFLPSLFMWSVSALKESLYLLLTSAVLVNGIALVRARSLGAKMMALAIVLGGGWWLETLRIGGRAITLGGVASGYASRIVTLRRWLVAAVGIACLAGAVMVLRNGLPSRIQNGFQESARRHRGHVFTPGHSYKVLDQRFYSSVWGPLIDPILTGPETARYALRAARDFVVQPVPWSISSKLEAAYMPEQLVWFVTVLLLPAGVVVGFKRDALLTCVLAAYGLLSAGIIALNSGNIGTLVRHRALVAPYLGWIAAVGLISVLAASGRERASRS